MSKISFIAALLLGLGLSGAFAQDPREKTRPGPAERPPERTLRPLPPVTPESAFAPAPTPPQGTMPMTRTPAAADPGQPHRPIDPRAPLVSVQLALAEVLADAAGKAGPEPKPPASSDLARGTATLPLDLSAPSERIVEELRKLGIRGRLEILYQMQLSTVDQQSASFNLGVSKPTIHGLTMTQFGQSNNIQYINTGLRVEVQPRVTGGAVAITVNLSDSRLSRAEEGVPIAIPAKGEPIRAPLIQQITLQTTVNVPSGQTTVLSGLTAEEGPRKRQLIVLLCPRVIPLNASEPSRRGR